MKRFTLLSALVLACFVPAVWAENWPLWRGPGNDGVCSETKLPLQWSETKNLVWKVPLPGKAGATPVIWGDRLFVSSGDGKDVALLCISTDGKELWKRKLGAGGKMKINPGETNDAANSPSTDGKHVFAFDGAGDFVCFDFDGKEIWRFNSLERYGDFKTEWGMHTTPLLHGDRLYLTLLSAKGHWIICLDKATGKEVWKAARPTDAVGENKEAYTSPYIWNHGKESCLVVLGCDYLTGHRLSDGGEIWRLLGNPPRTTAYRLVTTPVGTADLLVACTGRGNGGPVVCLKWGAQGAIAEPGPFVQWKLPKSAPDVSSPLIHDGLVYLAGENSQQFLTCVDLTTGKELYKQRIQGGKFRASPVYADGKILVTGHDGHFTVVTPGRTYQELAVNQLRDQFSASPAISNGRIYLRGWQNLYAIAEGAK